MIRCREGNKVSRETNSTYQIWVERMQIIFPSMISCYASKMNTETGSPARPTIIVEKLTVKFDAQQLRSQAILYAVALHK